MVRGKEITGLPILDQSEGRKLGSIKDIVLDISKREIVGFTVDTGGFFGPGGKVLPMTEIKSIGPDAVMVRDTDHEVIRDENDMPGIHEIMEEGHSIFGKKIVTRSGTELGEVTDIIVEPSNGKVEAYEISGGLAQDIGHGRSTVPLTDDFTAGEDAIIVPDETETRMREGQEGGLAETYAGVKEKAGEAGGKAQELFVRTKGKVEETVSREKSQLEKDEIEAMRGHTTRRRVEADGMVIAEEDQVINDEVIDRAKTRDKVHELALAAGLSGFEERYEKARRSTTETIGRAEEELLIGNMAGQKVTDREGNVIVSEGDKITYEAVQKARQAGVVGDLLASAGIAGARSFWASLRDSFARYREQTAHGSAEASQRRFLVGRVSDTDVSDNQGGFIVRQGEVITPLMVETIKDQDKLEEIRVRPD